MDTNVKQLLTKEGLSELTKEHEELATVKRPEAVQRLSDARELGDLSENSEYAAAKQDLAFIDGRIIELEELLHSAKVISPKKKDSIDVGSKVTLHINGKHEVYMLVGEWEADPMNKKISHSSPLGQALLGKKVGDTADVEAPVGKIRYKIVEIL